MLHGAGVGREPERNKEKKKEKERERERDLLKTCAFKMRESVSSLAE